jgi:endonuclease YncB( thermonuclease family)
MTEDLPPAASGRARLRRRILAGSIIALLAILIGWSLTKRQPSAPQPAGAPAVAALPTVPTGDTPGAPNPAVPPSAAEPSQVEPAPVPVVEAPPTPPAAPAPPPLTSVQVAERPIHEVPPEKNPPPLDSTALDMTKPPPGYPGAGRHPSEGSTRSAPKQFAGAAKVMGATSLMVDGIPVELFGVKAPLPGDKCELGGVAMSCFELAKRRLGERLGLSNQVNCRTPNPQPGLVVAFAICLDARGIDLGSYLLNEGLALADTGQSYDYVGAEGVARTLKHGLWKFR